MANNQVSLLGVIEEDLKGAVQWVEAEAQSVGVTLWSIFKAGILSVTSAQAQVFVNVVSRFQSDTLAGKTIEQIETDLLNEALQDELKVLTTVESAVLQALIAAYKAS